MRPDGHFTRRILRAATFAGRAAGLAGALAVLSQCAHQTPVSHAYSQPRLGDNRFVSQDGTAFGYRKWINSRSPVDTVVVGLHGFCGASIDFENLGKHVADHHRGTAVYAYELRGQGNDPVRKRRGDIDDPANWSRDLLTFTSLVRREHPDAKIIWFGESMGALIASHTHKERVALDPDCPPCDAIILSSPVVTVRGDFPKWKKDALLSLSRVMPKVRLSLETLAGGQAVQMTHSSTHSEQSETNSWNIETHTLRLLSALGGLIDDMNAAAGSFRVPTLVAHGGKDFFTKPSDVIAFCDRITHACPADRFFYPESYHLLMYDNDRERVIADISGWIDALPP